MIDLNEKLDGAFSKQKTNGGERKQQRHLSQISRSCLDRRLRLAYRIEKAGRFAFWILVKSGNYV
jgi:hypothetical protein